MPYRITQRRCSGRRHASLLAAFAAVATLAGGCATFTFQGQSYGNRAEAEAAREQFFRQLAEGVAPAPTTIPLRLLVVIPDAAYARAHWIRLIQGSPTGLSEDQYLWLANNAVVESRCVVEALLRSRAFDHVTSVDASPGTVTLPASGQGLEADLLLQRTMEGGWEILLYPSGQPRPVTFQQGATPAESVARLIAQVQADAAVLRPTGSAARTADLAGLKFLFCGAAGPAIEPTVLRAVAAAVQAELAEHVLIRPYESWEDAVAPLDADSAAAVCADLGRAQQADRVVVASVTSLGSSYVVAVRAAAAGGSGALAEVRQGPVEQLIELCRATTAALLLHPELSRATPSAPAPVAPASLPASPPVGSW